MTGSGQKTILWTIPEMYPAKTIERNKRLFPWVERDFIDFQIENGHAAPKQTSIIISKILMSKEYSNRGCPATYNQAVQSQLPLHITTEELKYDIFLMVGQVDFDQ